MSAYTTGYDDGKAGVPPRSTRTRSYTAGYRHGEQERALVKTPTPDDAPEPSVYFFAGYHDAREGKSPETPGSADYMRGYRQRQAEDKSPRQGRVEIVFTVETASFLTRYQEQEGTPEELAAVLHDALRTRVGGLDLTQFARDLAASQGQDDVIHSVTLRDVYVELPDEAEPSAAVPL